MNPWRAIASAVLLLVPLLVPLSAQAQDAGLDDKLRDLLRQTTVQLRAAEDAQATLQSQLDTMTHQRDALQAQLTALQGKPAAAAVTPEQLAALKQAQAGLAAARAQNAAYAASIGKVQAQYQSAAAAAAEKDAADRRDAAALKAATGTLAVCTADNTKLIAVAEDILHLYETPQWNRLLIANHDRLLGFARVKLENLVQDYDDKIAAQAFMPAAPPPR
jgi:chromosome segregation ATPase